MSTTNQIKTLEKIADHYKLVATASLASRSSKPEGYAQSVEAAKVVIAALTAAAQGRALSKK